jgi:transposase InsO family protein
MQAHAGARRDLRCFEGVVFAGFVVFVFSRRVVAWQFASHMRTDLVLDAQRMALTDRDPRRRRQARASQRRRLEDTSYTFRRSSTIAPS